MHLLKDKAVRVSAFLCALVGALMVPGMSFAAEDYSDLTTGLGGEISAAVPVALAALGTFIAIVIAVRVIRRIVRA